LQKDPHVIPRNQFKKGSTSMKKSTKFLLYLLVFLLLLSPSTLFASAAQADGQRRTDKAATALIPGGIPFGVKFTTDGVLIVGFCDIEQVAPSAIPQGRRALGSRTF
jgi:hypothetical protein